MIGANSRIAAVSDNEHLSRLNWFGRRNGFLRNLQPTHVFHWHKNCSFLYRVPKHIAITQTPH